MPIVLSDGKPINYAHALNHPRLEEFASDLKPELEVGARVCQALAMAFTADKQWDYNDDIKRVRARLVEYRAVVDDEVPGSETKA